MARRKDDDDLWKFFLGLGGIVVGTILLSYAQSGRRGDNATMLPDELERHIDDGVAALDAEYGKGWVDEGLNAVAATLRRVLPSQLVLLADAFYWAETEFMYAGKAGFAKKRRVMHEAARLGLVRQP